jgi:putative intracellular protease/amidase
MRILIILSADAESSTGLIEAYYLFRDAGMDVVVSAIGGGSASPPAATTASEALQRFKSDRDARDVMNDLVDLGSVCAGDFDAAIWFGADTEPRAGGLVSRLLAAAKPVAVIAPANAPAQAAQTLLGVLGKRER